MAFLIGHSDTCYIRLLASLTPHNRSNVLCSAPLCSFCYTHSTCSLHSWGCSFTLLTPSWDGWNSWICVHAENAFNRNNRVLQLHSRHALIPAWISAQLTKFDVNMKDGLDALSLSWVLLCHSLECCLVPAWNVKIREKLMVWLLTRVGFRRKYSMFFFQMQHYMTV